MSDDSKKEPSDAPRGVALQGAAAFTAAGNIGVTGDITAIAESPKIIVLAHGALLIPEANVPEGMLVKTYADLWIQLARELGNDWTKAFNLSDREWEEMLAGAFKRDKFDEVILTPRSGDHGRDVIAFRKPMVGSIRILASMKAYSPNNTVPRSHVDEMLGVLTRESGGTKALIATTSDFAPDLFAAPGLKELVPGKVELMNGAKLQKWLKTLTGGSE
jgi:restriction system protein